MENVFDCTEDEDVVCSLVQLRDEREGEMEIIGARNKFATGHIFSITFHVDQVM